MQNMEKLFKHNDEGGETTEAKRRKRLVRSLSTFSRHDSRSKMYRLPLSKRGLCNPSCYLRINKSYDIRREALISEMKLLAKYLTMSCIRCTYLSSVTEFWKGKNKPGALDKPYNGALIDNRS